MIVGNDNVGWEMGQFGKRIGGVVGLGHHPRAQRMEQIFNKHAHMLVVVHDQKMQLLDIIGHL